MAKSAPAKKALTKSQLFTNIGDATGLKKNQVAAVFDALTKEIEKQLGKNGVGQITLPGLVKMVRRKKPPQPAKQMRKPGGAPGEMIDVPAKPASTTVRVRALKPLKAMIN